MGSKDLGVNGRNKNVERDSGRLGLFGKVELWMAVERGRLQGL